MKKSQLLFATFIFGLSMSFIGCKESEPQPQTYNGASEKLGNGTVFQSVRFSETNQPTNISLTFSKASLEGLSHTALTAVVVKLPAEAIGKTPFSHAFITFSHTGHEPPGIYDLPHFDVHFYTQSLAEREAIPPYMPTTAAKFDNLPPDGVMPKPYIRLPAGVPTMGTHWADPTSPELNGGKFTETFVLGSYDGKSTFWEPMITLATMSSSPNISKNIPLATKFSVPGYYPTKYSIKQVGTDIVVSLDDLVMRQ